MVKTKPSTCSTCSHWKNEQAELEYTKFHGICTNPCWKFNISGYRDVVVLDRGNRSATHMGVQRFENQKNSVEKSRYAFVTEEGFGCIHHDLKKKK